MLLSTRIHLRKDFRISIRLVFPWPNLDLLSLFLRTCQVIHNVPDRFCERFVTVSELFERPGMFMQTARNGERLGKFESRRTNALIMPKSSRYGHFQESLGVTCRIVCNFNKSLHSFGINLFSIKKFLVMSLSIINFYLGYRIWV
jgi:hypothetical protein